METKPQMEYDFDAEKVMNMTREEAISLLGEENAIRVNDGLKDGTLTYSEFERICQERFPIPQQSKLVRNVIFNQLSKTEGFNMFESNREKQEQYAKMASLREKAEKGELTQEELKQLCDKVFGEDSSMSRKIQDELIAKGKVRQSNKHIQKGEQDEYASSSKRTNIGQEKKSWELDSEEKSKIQKDSVVIAQKHHQQEEKQKQTTSQEIEQVSQQSTESQQVNQVSIPVQPQQPMMDMGGMEL